MTEQQPEKPIGPHAWAEHYNQQREQAPQPGRHTADTITSDALDQLYARAEKAEAKLTALAEIDRGYCPDCGRGDASPTTAQWYEQRTRAEQAEADATDLRARLQATSDAYNNVTIALGEALAKFRFDTHPGRRCKQSDHVPVETIERWRAALDLKESTP